MAKRLSLPGVLGGVLLGFVTGVSVTFGAIMVTGVSAADEPGTPFDARDVTISATDGTAKTTTTPDAAARADAGADAAASDSSYVVPALPPVEVTLDDHGGDSNGDGDSGSNSGSSGSSGSGSSGSSGSNSGSSGSNSSGSNSSGDSTP
jgi:hypothetical protein